jgi:hypothetical protein
MNGYVIMPEHVIKSEHFILHITQHFHLALVTGWQ